MTDELDGVKVSTGFQEKSCGRDTSEDYFYLNEEEGVFSIDADGLETALDAPHRVHISRQIWSLEDGALEVARFKESVLEVIQGNFSQLFPLPGYLEITIGSDYSWVRKLDMHLSLSDDFEYPNYKAFQADIKKYGALAKALGSNLFAKLPDNLKLRKGYVFKDGKIVREVRVGLSEITYLRERVLQGALSFFTGSQKSFTVRDDANRPAEEVITLLKTLAKVAPPEYMVNTWQFSHSVSELESMTRKGAELGLKKPEHRKKREELIKILRVLATLINKAKKQTATTKDLDESEEG
jgi:hypothetical protein